MSENISEEYGCPDCGGKGVYSGFEKGINRGKQCIFCLGSGRVGQIKMDTWIAQHPNAGKVGTAEVGFRVLMFAGTIVGFIIFLLIIGNA